MLADEEVVTDRSLCCPESAPRWQSRHVSCSPRRPIRIAGAPSESRAIVPIAQRKRVHRAPHRREARQRAAGASTHPGSGAVDPAPKDHQQTARTTR